MIKGECVWRTFQRWGPCNIRDERNRTLPTTHTTPLLLQRDDTLLPLVHSNLHISHSKSEQITVSVSYNVRLNQKKRGTFDRTQPYQQKKKPVETKVRTHLSFVPEVFCFRIVVSNEWFWFSYSLRSKIVRKVKDLVNTFD
jgi:hypothetical protein